jgi:hypothetical protein
VRFDLRYWYQMNPLLAFHTAELDGWTGKYQSVHRPEGCYDKPFHENSWQWCPLVHSITMLVTNTLEAAECCVEVIVAFIELSKERPRKLFRPLPLPVVECGTSDLLHVPASDWLAS